MSVMINLNAQQVINYKPQLIDLGTITNQEIINKTLYTSLTENLGDVIVFTLKNEADVFFRFPAFNEAFGENYISIVKRNNNTGSLGDFWEGEYICKDFPLYEFSYGEVELYLEDEYIDMYLLKTRLVPGSYMITSKYPPENSPFEEGYYLYNLSLEFEGDFTTFKFMEQSINKNYLIRILPSIETKDIIFTENVIKFDNSVQAQITTQYFDGLGRAIQKNQQEFSPDKKDVVVIQEYDNLGREWKTWLSSAISSNSGAYFNPYLIKQNSKVYNGDARPYSEITYKQNPLNEISSKYNPGEKWFMNSKSIETETLINTSKGELSCNYYKIEGRYINTQLKSNSTFPSGELVITKTKDEDGNKLFEFKNKLGQVVLMRQINNGEKHDTYYVYDISGNLSYVLPPLAANTIDCEDTSQTIHLYAYLYKYDRRNRCIAKKLPGCGWVYYLYDKTDQLIFTQDSEQRLKGEWLFLIPDAMGRIAVTGICKNSFDYMTDPLKNVVVKGTWANVTNSYKGYNISGITLSNPTIQMVNYYDNYEFLGLNGIPPATTGSNTAYEAKSGYGVQYIGGHKGLMTGTLSALLEENVNNNYLYSVIYYDNKGRVILTRSNNHLGGTETEYLAYNFTGQPLKKRQEHSVGNNTIPEEYAYLYDHTGRLLTTTHKLNEGQEIILAENTYDELGRLLTNKKGNNENLKSTFNYNVRSWTKAITSPLFSQRLYYNEQQAGSTPLYNGNISAMEWQVDGENCTRGYTFAYDNLSRLTGASYLQNGAANDNYRTAYSYDKHGNMLTTLRYGKATATAYGIIDNLAMTYNGNQLERVSDSGENVMISESADFKDYSTGNGQYTYNHNGAMATDSHKGIFGISYNSLNLPTELAIKNTNTSGKTYYTYSASGVKLRTEHKSSSNLNYVPVSGTGGDSNLDIVKITDYVGNKIYENGQLKRVLVDGGYIEDGIYYFYLTDHLGNNRVVAKADGTVTQKNHYYPFGMEFADNSGDEQPYKYNGKELDKMHGLNMYDFSARFYETSIGRFSTVDPHAENYYSWSPYAYCANNPFRITDPTGMDWLTEKDRKTAESMTNNLTNLRDGLNKDIAKANSDKNKIQNNSKMSQSDKDKEIGTLDDEINNLTLERDALNISISDVSTLTNSEQLYTFNEVSGGTPYLERSSAEDGVIIINHSGSLENKSHELHHASQYDQGKIVFVAGSTDMARGGSLTLTQAEIGSYMIQYSINKRTMPQSTGGTLNSIYSITDKWLRGVNDGNGNFPYKNHY